MKFFISLFLIAILIFSIGATPQEKKNARKSQISFSNDIYPIIKKRCLPCHASDSENPSELFMESYQDIMNGGKHGKPIVAKKGDESIIVQKIKPTPPFGEQMPLMTKNKLTEEEVEVFKLWIDQGARKN